MTTPDGRCLSGLLEFLPDSVAPTYGGWQGLGCWAGVRSWPLGDHGSEFVGHPVKGDFALLEFGEQEPDGAPSSATLLILRGD